jgi:hypothetical protein
MHKIVSKLENTLKIQTNNIEILIMKMKYTHLAHVTAYPEISDAFKNFIEIFKLVNIQIYVEYITTF